MDAYGRVLKQKMYGVRINGLLVSLVGIASIVFYFFQVINPFLCLVLLCYSIGIVFILNSTYQEVRSGKIYSKLNLAFSFLFLAITVGLVVYCFVKGYLRF